MLETTKDFIKRHFTWICIAWAACLGIAIIPGVPNEIMVILMTVVISTLALAITSVALYVLTPLKFADFSFMDNGSYSDTLKGYMFVGKTIAISIIFFAICHVSAGVIEGVYYILKAN